MICFKKEKYFEFMILRNFEQLSEEVDCDVTLLDFGYGNQNENLTSSSTYRAPEGR